MASQQGRGLSVRQLTLIFFGLAGVCALFFALGFLTGANRRSAAPAPTTEQVSPPSVVPPPVNPPPDNASGGSASKTQASVVEQDLKPPAQAATTQAATTAAATTINAGSDGARATGGESLARTAPVATEAHAPTGSRGRGIMVQVAALRTEQDAKSLLTTLRSHGYRAVVVTPEEAQAGDTLYRVQVGPFHSRADALKILHKLGGEGFRPFIRE